MQFKEQFTNLLQTFLYRLRECSSVLTSWKDYSRIRPKPSEVNYAISSLAKTVTILGPEIDQNLITKPTLN